MRYLLKKLTDRTKLSRVFRERLVEPVHMNVLSLFVALFGTFRMKVDFDLVIRQQNAFCLLKAAEFAVWKNLRSVTVIEFGVATGAGLLNICRIARKVTKATGVRFDIVGFDTGTGLPPPQGYRDHPEFFMRGEGAFAMTNRQQLESILPDNARLIFGNIEDTVLDFRGTLSEESPIGLIAVDVDYYSSAKSCLKVLLDENPRKYMPMTLVYLDDIGMASANPWAGELLAVNEFNAENEHRKIHPYPFLRTQRIFKQTSWIDQVFLMHTLDHDWRNANPPAETL